MLRCRASVSWKPSGENYEECDPPRRIAVTKDEDNPDRIGTDGGFPTAS
jgi:hypothetical protein